MTTVKVTENVDADADAMFGILGDFAAIEGPGIDSCEITGEGIGMVRTLSLGGATVVERMDNHDVNSRTLTYSIINEDCPLPFKGYVSTLIVTPTGDNKCRVDWFSNFDVKGGGPEADAIKMAEGIYGGGIKGASAKLAG